MSKIGISGNISASQRQKAQEFFTKTLKELGLTEEQNVVQLYNTDGSTVDLPLFEYRGGEDNLAYSITYLTAQGGRITYKKTPGAKWSIPYKRSRLIEATASGQKYTQDKGTEPFPYLTSIYKYYWSKGIETPQVVITEGEKKAHVLCATGIPAIAIPGIWGWGKKKVHHITAKKIGVKINPVLSEAILEHSLKQITFLFDADQRSLKKNLTFYQASKHFLMAVRHMDINARIAFQEPLIIKGEEPKGIDDLLYLSTRIDKQTATSINTAIEDSLIGGIKTKYIHVERLHLFRKEKNLNKVLEGVAEYLGVYSVPLNPSVPTERLEVKKYLSECAKELYALAQENTKLVVQAPTGSGKTAGILGEVIPQYVLPNNPKAFCVFLVPTLSILDNITTGDSKELVPFERVDGTTPKHTLEHINNPDNGVNVVLSTYDGLSKINRSIDWVFVDEAHRLTSDNSYRSEALINIERKLFGSLSSPNTNTVFLSAQPSLYFEHFGFSYAEVVPEEVTQKEVSLKMYHSSTAVVIDRLVKRIAKSSGNFAIRIQSKNTLNDIKEALIQSGLSPEEVLIVTSENREDTTRKELLSKEELPKGVRVLLSTSILDEGVNINNQVFEGVYFIADKLNGVLNPTSAIQFMNRFRKIGLGSGCEFTVYLKADKRTGSNCYSPKSVLEQKLEFAGLHAESFSSPGALGSADAPELYGSLEDSGKCPIVYFDAVEGEYMPYTFGVIQETETYFDRKRSSSQFLEELKADRTIKLKIERDTDTSSQNLLIEKVRVERENTEDNIYILFLLALRWVPLHVFSLFESRLNADRKNPLLYVLERIFSSTLGQHNTLSFLLPALTGTSKNVKQKVEHKLLRIMEFVHLGYNLKDSVEYTLGISVYQNKGLADFFKFNAIYNKLINREYTGKLKATQGINGKDLAITEAYNRVRLRLMDIAKRSNQEYSVSELLFLIRENTPVSPGQRKAISVLTDREVMNAIAWFTYSSKRRTKAGYKYCIEEVLSVKASADRWSSIISGKLDEFLQGSAEVSEGNILPYLRIELQDKMHLRPVNTGVPHKC